MNLEQKMEPIMLSTEEATHLHKRIDDGVLQKTIRPNNQNPCWEPQHLSICSNIEIKEGDWVIWNNSNTIEQVSRVGLDLLTFNTTHLKAYKENCKKIEASTDTSLGLPNIPTEFIQEYVEKYNEGNPIREVNVEMEITTCSVCIQLEGQYKSPDCCGQYEPIIKILKDNTINLSRVEETWDDIKKAFDTEFFYNYPSFVSRTFKWLKTIIQYLQNYPNNGKTFFK